MTHDQPPRIGFSERFIGATEIVVPPRLRQLCESLSNHARAEGIRR